MLRLDLTKRAARMLEQGRVTMTFRSPSGSHITLLAKCRGKTDAGKWVATNLAEAKLLFIEVPNEGGWNDKVGKVTRSGGFTPERHADDARVFCARQMLSYLTGGQTAAGLEIFEEDRCGACGRQLTDPVSIERGIGPECYGRITGSQHEPKVPDTAVPTPEPPAKADIHTDLSAALEAVGTGIEEIEPAFRPATPSRQAQTDRNGAPYVGDWRARQAYAEQVREPVEISAEYSQMDTLPGETWGDIFRPRAAEMGLTLPENA